MFVLSGPKETAVQAKVHAVPTLVVSSWAKNVWMITAVEKKVIAMEPHQLAPFLK